MNTVAVIDAGGANFGSVCYALERLDARPIIVRDADELAAACDMATRILLPGVGAAAPAMALLEARGLLPALRAPTLPLLGICLGMQLLFDASDEGDVACLGLLPGRVQKLVTGPGLRVPQMGWNTLQLRQSSPLLEGIAADAHAYFVHSYAAPVCADCIASSTHGQPFAALVQRGRVAGAQFHPERSASAGARLLANFLQWNPA